MGSASSRVTDCWDLSFSKKNSEPTDYVVSPPDVLFHESGPPVRAERRMKTTREGRFSLKLRDGYCPREGISCGALSDDILRESRDRSCHSALEIGRGCSKRAHSLDEHLTSPHQLTAREMLMFTVNWNLPARPSSDMHLSSLMSSKGISGRSLFQFLSFLISWMCSRAVCFIEQRMCRGHVSLFPSS